MADKKIVGLDQSSIKKENKNQTIFLFVLGIVIIYICYYAPIGFVLQWAIAIVSMIVIGNVIIKNNSLVGSWGLFLIGTRNWIEIIDNVSKKYKSFWNNMPIWGMVLGFGLFTYPLLKGKIDKRMYLFGMMSLIFILLFVLPYTQTLYQFLSIPQLQQSLQSASQAPTADQQLLAIVAGAATVIFGLSGYILISLFYNASSIILRIITFVTSYANGVTQTSILTGAIPGVAPVIPGITIPLVAGIISLAILLIIHEFSHGVLARLFNVKIKAVGLAVFGIIPIGGFVEPDEKNVDKLDSLKQSKIYAAGIAANFIAMIFFFALVYLFLLYVIPGVYANAVYVQTTAVGYPAYGVLHPGDQILFWNGHQINNISSFSTAGAEVIANSIVVVTTNTGTYSLKAIGSGSSTRGFIGITVDQPLSTALPAQIEYFLYSVFVLSFVLNFLVAIVNLLPFPIFDGWRIYKANIKNDAIVKGLAIATVFAFVVNALPWLFVAFA